jgi:O-antigen/teichoic acid export membrane protein
MTILSDGGISTGVMAQGGKVWQDRQKLGAVLATGLDLRRKFAIVSLIVSIPILCYLLLHHGANWITTLLISASLIPAFYASLSDGLLQIPVKLHQSIPSLQRNQVEVGIGRLLLTGITLFAFPWAFVAIIANGIPRIWGNVKLRKIAEGFVDKEQTVDSAVKDEILKVVKKVLPGSIYYAISGQLTIWLISIFGNTTSVAQLGALGRLSMILSVFNVVITMLVTPRFARMKADFDLLLKRFVFIILSLFLIMGVSIGVTHVFSNQLLWLLGKEYSVLNFELFLCISGNFIALISGVIFSLHMARGWVLNPVILILLNLVSLILGMVLFDISDLQGILFYNIFITTIQLVITTTYCFYKIYAIKNDTVYLA